MTSTKRPGSRSRAAPPPSWAYIAAALEEDARGREAERTAYRRASAAEAAAAEVAAEDAARAAARRAAAAAMGSPPRPQSAPRPPPRAPARAAAADDAARARHLLGVSAAVGEKELRAAWRKRARAVHPDRPGGDKHEFQALSDALECLLRATPAR